MLEIRPHSATRSAGAQLLLGLDGATAHPTHGAGAAARAADMESRSVLAYDVIASRGTGPVVVTIASELGWSLVGVMGSAGVERRRVALISARGLDARCALRCTTARRTPAGVARARHARSERQHAKALAAGRPPARARRTRAEDRRREGADAQTGHFILHSNVMPTLTAGHYELVTEQDGLPFNVAAEHTHVTVAAPRYTMPTGPDPVDVPAGERRGRVRRPAARRSCSSGARCRGSATRPSSQPSPTPWLALVVVAEGEAELSTATPVARVRDAGHDAARGQQDKDVEQGLYLAVTETVVKKIFPCEEDLQLLVHVREVDINDTELANGDDDGWLAVVLANRLPVFDAAAGKAGALHGLPRQRRGSARRASAAGAARRRLHLRAGRRTGRCSRRSRPRSGPTRA